jgi:aminoglycoside 6'-N-acetyltransferase
MNDVIAADGDLVIRPVREEAGDYESIVGWRNSPHVREWWDPDDPPLTLAGLRDELDAQIPGDDTTTSCIIEHSGEPVGFIQFYPWDAEEEYLAEIGVTVPPGSWGLDIFIGKSGLEGTGVGSRAVKVLSDALFSRRGATAVALITEAGNARAQASCAWRALSRHGHAGRSAGRIHPHDPRPARRNSWRAMISRCTSDAPS